jgi:GTP pyrophosphokinase
MGAATRMFLSARCHIDHNPFPRTRHNGTVELFTDWHTWDETEPEVRRLLTPETADLVARAVGFAREAHGDQRRATGVPYLEHLLETLEVLMCGALVTSPDVLAAGALHDVIEDTARTEMDICQDFGPRVAELVGWVSKPADGQAKESYLTGLKNAPRDAILVKLADRASNVQTLRNLPFPRQRMYYAQTIRYIVPLAGSDPWFADWYATWAREFSDLAADPAAPARPADEQPDQQ